MHATLSQMPETRIGKPTEIEQLKQRLQEIRKASLAATQRGDYMKVARLTTEAATINRTIIQMAGPIWG
jgi:hypothetical protein